MRGAGHRIMPPALINASGGIIDVQPGPRHRPQTRDVWACGGPRAADVLEKPFSSRTPIGPARDLLPLASRPCAAAVQDVWLIWESHGGPSGAETHPAWSICSERRRATLKCAEHARPGCRMRKWRVLAGRVLTHPRRSRTVGGKYKGWGTWPSSVHQFTTTPLHSVSS